MPRSKKTYVFPLVALRGRVVFPDAQTSFDAGRLISLTAISRATEKDMDLFVSLQKDAAKENITSKDVCAVGTVVRVKQIAKLPSNNLRVSVEGLYRAEAEEIYEEDGSFYAVVTRLKAVHGDEVLEEAYFRTAREVMRELTAGDMRFPKEQLAELERVSDPDVFINRSMQYLHLKEEIKQQILETVNVVERLKLYERCLNDELEIAKLEKKISSMVRRSIDKNQKEYFLREQLKAIHTELGDDEQERDTLTRQIKDKHMPAEIEEKALKEISRMDKMPPSSPEYTVIRNYLDWLIELPWTEETKDTENILDAKKILDEDHYGLEKVKTRITEYLAVLQLTKSMNAPILCFVGPPGVGKTSIAKSVARALGRKFVRMSLGGVKDEAEIRGHRRTYVGAMPGRIIYAMKQVGSINPVFLLDEIDKVSSDMRGDPASALLEVLDPEQNATFRDRFLEVPYDLSKVLFITTANTVDTIPAPLLDRMELIELNGYTLDEKREIAKRYLVPRKIQENGLKSELLEITDDAITAIIEGYTMEAGVRSLERQIGSVCRMIAVRYAENKDMEKQVVTAENLEGVLGVKKYTRDFSQLDENEVGAATGLAWTSVGGTTLTIEVSCMPGKGEILLTGKLGDVMKESARAAISYIRAHADKYGIDAETFSNTDIHIHVPEGATPKDGPSAGITMATAILSAFTHKPVRKDIAMTGEITLRGKVLPIGGLKEKALAAHRAGIKNIIIPKENEKDEEEIPSNVRGELHFIPAAEVDTVFHNAIAGL
ncbi:MAG TPA: endopeptidase La [Candidatus Borkfalkia avistercoris]|uniref:Lon protease n=1 Tax=Candidatus Borkfalkia avistercoris TaxID=2838504 RepID=A0A9D2CYF3_9FIRM|nr:endopeptidase La [Candidatus Borkfalkia avistercoris]